MLVGVAETWASRFWLSPDGTNYLDIASAYARHDWHLAVNAYWSPFFSWILALIFALFQPSAYNDSTALRLVNLAGLLIALACFEFLVASLLRVLCQHVLPLPPRFYFWLLAYALFLSTVFFVVDLQFASTPDIWLAALTCLACGILLRIRATGGSLAFFAVLGAVLGFAYLTKTFYFALSPVYLAAAWLATGAPRANLKRLALAAVTFAFVAGPWIVILSRSEHRFTYGDVGKIAFAMTNDRLPQQTFWRGENKTGVPLHPVRQLLDRPHIFDYSSRARATYPPMFDRSYWMAGVQPRFSLRGLALVLRQSAGSFLQFLFGQAEFLVLLLALLVAAGRSRARASFWSLRHLWFPAVVACAAYSVVLVEGRYVASFVLILWLAALGALIAATEIPPAFLRALILSVAIVCGLRVAKLAETDLLAITSQHTNTDWEAAQALAHLGARPGDHVAGLGIGGNIHWARLAELTLVAEVPPGEDSAFFASDEFAKQHVFDSLAGAGAKFVVTQDPPPGAETSGWIRLGPTSLFAHRLETPEK